MCPSKVGVSDEGSVGGVNPAKGKWGDNPERPERPGESSPRGINGEVDAIVLLLLLLVTELALFNMFG